MLIKVSHPHPIKPSEITPVAAYHGRRRFLLQMGLATASAALGGCGAPAPDSVANVGLARLNVAQQREMAGGETVTAYDDITHYNNFYEFGTTKEDPARNAGGLRTRPWSVVVDGECEAPGRIDLDDLIKPQALQERIYRHRCVEGWSMVASWVGFGLSRKARNRSAAPHRDRVPGDALGRHCWAHARTAHDLAEGARHDWPAVPKPHEGDGLPHLVDRDRGCTRGHRLPGPRSHPSA